MRGVGRAVPAILAALIAIAVATTPASAAGTSGESIFTGLTLVGTQGYPVTDGGPSLSWSYSGFYVDRMLHLATVGASYTLEGGGYETAIVVNGSDGTLFVQSASSSATNFTGTVSNGTAIYAGLIGQPFILTYALTPVSTPLSALLVQNAGLAPGQSTLSPGPLIGTLTIA